MGSLAKRVMLSQPKTLFRPSKFTNWRSWLRAVPQRGPMTNRSHCSNRSARRTRMSALPRASSSAPAKKVSAPKSTAFRSRNKPNQRYLKYSVELGLQNRKRDDSRKACPEPFGSAQDKLRRRSAKNAKFKQSHNFETRNPKFETISNDTLIQNLPWPLFFKLFQRGEARKGEAERKRSNPSDEDCFPPDFNSEE